MTVILFIVNTRAGTCLSYYLCSLRLDKVSGTRLNLRLHKILNIYISYFVLKKFALTIVTDFVSTIFAEKCGRRAGYNRLP